MWRNCVDFEEFELIFRKLVYRGKNLSAGGGDFNLRA